MAYKIVFAGQVGAGKTTAINAISDIPVVSTEANTSDSLAQTKQKTTVAMDYGALHLSNDDKVFLYGTPGQERFNFMWEILSVGALGIVLLIDHSQAQPVQDMRFYLDTFSSFTKQGAVAIGVTHMDLTEGDSLAPYLECLQDYHISVPVFEVDARESRDVKTLVLSLLAMLDQDF
ncbi:MAG: ATP/GTP-binding protein [Reinekea sp.]|jgi:uncharacterized protein